MKPGRQHLSSVRATHAHLLPGLIAIAVIMSAPGWALGGLHVVPSPFVNNSKLIGTAAIAANDIWAVGDIVSNSGLTTTTLAEHFDGTTWSVVPTPTLRSGGFIDGVAAVASNDVWAVGGEGSLAFQPLIEHWNGTSWSKIPSPPLSNGGFLNGVTAISSNDIWAVGVINNSSDSLVEHWDGTSWSVISSPAFTGAGGLNGISADGTNDVWAVGGTAILHWDGATWSTVSAPPPIVLLGVTALSPTNAWAVGSQRLDSRHVRAQIEHWDGASWGVFLNPDPGTSFSALNGIAAVSSSDIWAVGQVFGQTLTEHWDGTRWRIINSPNPGRGGNRLFGVTALSTGTVVAVGDTCDASCSALILGN